MELCRWKKLWWSCHSQSQKVCFPSNKRTFRPTVESLSKMTKMIGLFEIYSVVNSHNEMNMNKCRPMLMMAPL